MKPTVKDTLHRVTTGMHRALFRASKGSVSGKVLGMPVIELVTIGRKSGKERATMLTVPITEDGRLVLVASFGGDDRHPAWYHNLVDHPQVRVTSAGSTRAMVARVATDEEKATLWPRIVTVHRGYESYQDKTSRPIPVVILEPTAD
jgi:deazaflavin-dependent oxidoreductase (nitroreductase family)